MKQKENHIFNRGNALRIACAISLLLLMLAGSASALYDSEAKSFLGLVNNYRAQNNLGSLSVDAALQDGANWMSNDMLTNCVSGKYTCSHTDSTGRTFDQRLRDFGYPAGISASAAENIAWGSAGGASTAQQVFDLWKNSPGHQANMLGSSYVAISISRSCNAGDCAWVTDFGSKIVKLYNPGQVPTPTPTLTPTPTPTSNNEKLLVESQPNGATVYTLNENSYLGTTPFYLDPTTLSTPWVKLIKNGYKTGYATIYPFYVPPKYPRVVVYLTAQ